jgi:hypothetical protein
MGNLVSETPLSEIMATLEVLDFFGVTRQDLRKLRSSSLEVKSHIARIIMNAESVVKISSISATPAQSDKEVFTIIVGDRRSAAELLAIGNYDWIGNYARQFVEGKQLRLAEATEEVDLVLVEFDHDLTSEAVLAKFRELGLVRPTEEDALRFGAKFPAEQTKYPLVFLHPSVMGPDGRLSVLALSGSEERGRGLRFAWSGGRWSRGERFVARRPRT